MLQTVGNTKEVRDTMEVNETRVNITEGNRHKKIQIQRRDGLIGESEEADVQMEYQYTTQRTQKVRTLRVMKLNRSQSKRTVTR